MSELNISIFEGLSFPIFVLTIALAYFLRAVVINYEKKNKIPHCK